MATFTVKEERKTEEIRQKFRVPEMEEMDGQRVVANGYVDGDGEVPGGGEGGGGGAGSPEVAQDHDPDLEPETGESEAVDPVKSTGRSEPKSEEEVEEERAADDGKAGSRSNGLIDYFKVKARSLSRDRTGNRALAKAVARSGSAEAVDKDGAPPGGKDGKRRSGSGGGRRKKWRIFGGKKSAKDHDQTSSDEGEGAKEEEGEEEQRKEGGEKKGVEQSEGKKFKLNLFARKLSDEQQKVVVDDDVIGKEATAVTSPKKEGEEEGEEEEEEVGKKGAKGVRLGFMKRGKRKKGGGEGVVARPGAGGEPEGITGKSSPSGDEDGKEAADDAKKTAGGGGGGKGLEKETVDEKSKDHHNRWFHFGRRGGDKNGDHHVTKENPDDTGAKGPPPPPPPPLPPPHKWNIFGKKTRKSEPRPEIQAAKEEVSRERSAEVEVELLSWKPLENADPVKEDQDIGVGLTRSAQPLESQTHEDDKEATDGIPNKKEPKKFSFGLKLGKKTKKPEDGGDAEKDVKGASSKVESVATIQTPSSTSEEEKVGTFAPGEFSVDGSEIFYSAGVPELPGGTAEAAPDLEPEGLGTDVAVDGTSTDHLDRRAGGGETGPGVENQVCSETCDLGIGEFNEVLLSEIDPERLASILEEPDIATGTGDEVPTVSRTGDEVPVAEQSTSLEVLCSSDNNLVPDIRHVGLAEEIQIPEIVAALEEVSDDANKESATTKDPGTSRDGGTDVDVVVELSPEPGGAAETVRSKPEEEILAEEEKPNGDIETSVKAEDRKEVKSKTAFKMWSPFTKKAAKRETPSTVVHVEGGKEIQVTPAKTPDAHGEEAPTVSGAEEARTSERDKPEVADPKHPQSDSREGTLKRNKALQKLLSFGKKPKGAADDERTASPPEAAMTSPEVVERKETEEEVLMEAGVSAEKVAAARRHDDDKKGRHKRFSFGLKTFARKHEKEPEVTEKEAPEVERPTTKAPDVPLSGPAEAEQQQPEAEKISEIDGNNLSDSPPSPPPPPIQDAPVSETSSGPEDTKDASPDDPEGSLTLTRPDKDASETPGKADHVTVKEPLHEHSGEAPSGSETWTPAPIEAVDDVTGPSDVITEGEPDVGRATGTAEVAPPGIEATAVTTPPVQVAETPDDDVSEEMTVPEDKDTLIQDKDTLIQDKDQHLDVESSRLPVVEAPQHLVLDLDKEEVSGDVQEKAGTDSPVDEEQHARTGGPAPTPEAKPPRKPLFGLKFGKKRPDVDGKSRDHSPRDEVAEAVVEPPGRPGRGDLPPPPPPAGAGKTGSDDAKGSTKTVEQLIIQVEVVETKEDSKAEEEDTKNRPLSSSSSSSGIPPLAHHVIKWPHFGGGGRKSDKKKEEKEDEKEAEEEEEECKGTPENEKDSTGKHEKTSGKKYSHGLGKGFLKMFSPKKHPKSGRNDDGGALSEQHQEAFLVYTVDRDGELTAETHWKTGKDLEMLAKSSTPPPSSSSPPPPSSGSGIIIITDSLITNGDATTPPPLPSQTGTAPEPEVVGTAVEPKSESPPDVVTSPRRPPSDDPGHFVVVAVDLGTTFSGYAFGFVSAPDSVHVMRKWEGGDPGVVDRKTPSALLLDPDGRFHSFGFTARDFYHDLDATETGRWAYFEKFKMVLHDNAELSEETKIVASNGSEFRALTIFAHSLRFFHDNALKELSSQSSVAIDNDDVRWVVTVPAIWSASAKQFMRTAAYEAGIASPQNPDRLLIALESEAASISVLLLLLQGPSQRAAVPRGTQSLPHSPKRGPPSSTPHRPDWLLEDPSGVDKTQSPASVDLKAGTRYATVDCGSGKVDIAVHEVESEKGRVREIHKATGGPFGSTGVDRQFERLLDEIFGAGLIEAFRRKRPGGWVDLMIAFESRKRAASPHKDNRLNISLPFSFIDFYKKQHGTQVDAAIEKFGGPGVAWSLQGMLSLTPEAMSSLFRPTIDGIKDAIRDVLKGPSVKGVEYLFLVGGFAESAVLQNEIRKEFDDQVKVIVPKEASLAVLKGAVCYGLDPTVVTARQSRMTYGVGAFDHFDPTRHPESKKVLKNGSDWCPGVFDPFVRSGETVTSADKVVRRFAPADGDQRRTCSVAIYGSESGEVRFVGDEGVRCHGTLRIERRRLANDDGTERDGVVKKALDGVECQSGRVIETTMTFGGTEIDVTARDVMTGLTTRAVVDFLNK